jgi:putative hydrolase of the HAD superfamily
VELPRTRVIFFDLGDTLVVPDDRSWVPGARDTLANLHSRGVRLGVISNTGDWSRDQLAQHLPVDFDWSLFEPRLVILSSEVGVEKPSPQIFQLAVEAAAVPAAECLFCSDDPRETLAAQRVGVLGARVQPPPRPDIGGLVEDLVAVGLLG